MLIRFLRQSSMRVDVYASGYYVGELVKNLEAWESNVLGILPIGFGDDELRQIVDKLDELNGVSDETSHN